MTIEELIEKYGDVGLKFNTYYEYKFTFSGKAPDGKTISWTYGDSSRCIFKYHVTTEGVAYKYHVTKGGIKTLDKIFNDPLSIDDDCFVESTNNGYEVISNDY